MDDYEGTMYRFRDNDPLHVSIQRTVPYHIFIYTLYRCTVLKNNLKFDTVYIQKPKKNWKGGKIK
jgi:hypothetical protein